MMIPVVGRIGALAAAVTIAAPAHAVLEVTAVPEPGTLSVFAAALVAIAIAAGLRCGRIVATRAVQSALIRSQRAAGRS